MFWDKMLQVILNYLNGFIFIILHLFVPYKFWKFGSYNNITEANTAF